MAKWFNTAGPCKPDIHYMLSPTQRMPDLKRLIAQENYFVVHAPRQTGKTTAMLTLAQELTASGAYAAVLVSAEVGAAFPDQPAIAENAILGAWWDAASFWLPLELRPQPWPQGEPGQRLGRCSGPGPSSRPYRWWCLSTRLIRCKIKL